VLHSVEVTYVIPQYPSLKVSSVVKCMYPTNLLYYSGSVSFHSKILLSKLSHR
jgi:hypothetical protein